MFPTPNNTAFPTYTFGSIMVSVSKGEYRYGFNGMEKDNELKGEGNSLDFGARIYDSRLGRWLSRDPLEKNFPSLSPYQFVENKPISLIDPDGNEPIKPQAGTISGFVKTLNTTGTQSGVKSGISASQAMLNFSITKFEGGRPMPQNTQKINTYIDKYIYTEKGGWIDMSHFIFYAGIAYKAKSEKDAAQKMLIELEKSKYGKQSEIYHIVKAQANQDPLAIAVQQGYWQEMSDRFFASHSAYSYEDLPSDYYGADFGANYFDPNSKLTLGVQLENYFNEKLKATTPEKAPNYDVLPEAEPTETPSATNHTVTPMYTTPQPAPVATPANYPGQGLPPP